MVQTKTQMKQGNYEKKQCVTCGNFAPSESLEQQLCLFNKAACFPELTDTGKSICTKTLVCLSITSLKFRIAS